MKSNWQYINQQNNLILNYFKMRTKHLLFSMALGATFAACSSEDSFDVISNDATDAKLSIRPIVGTEIVMGGAEAETRFALGTGARPVFSQNDKLGAAVIDVPLYKSAEEYATKYAEAGKKPIALYDVVNSYGCNNAFTTTDGGKTWSAEFPMVEGNYLFYAPYQANLNFRSPLKVEVPAIQNATTEKKALEEFYDGTHIVQVGYSFLAYTKDGVQKPSVKLYNIFAYPQFTIKNNFDGYLFDSSLANAEAAKAYSGEIKVDSIQFLNVGTSRAPKENMLVGGQLKHIQGQGVATGANAGVINALKEKSDATFAANGDWVDLSSALASKTSDLLDGEKGTVVSKRNNQSGVITTAILNKTIAKGGEYSFYLVMPGKQFNFADDQLMAKVYFTVNGVQYVVNDVSYEALANEGDMAELSANASAGTLFDAKKNAGLAQLSLMPGQRVPSEAIRVVTDSEGNKSYTLKTGVNDLLAINLVGGKATKGSATLAAQAGIRAAALNVGATKTSELIEMIQNAPNGTAWKEGDDADLTKGFAIAHENEVVINAALIDALAESNGNTGGSFEINTVVPIANDVKVTAVEDKSATFTSVNGKTYDIAFTGAVNTPAEGKYAIVTAAKTVSTDISGAVVIACGNTVTFETTDPKVKSLHVSTKAGSAAVISIASTIDNICNYGTLTASENITSKDIYNGKTMSVSKKLVAPTTTPATSLALTNVGTINIAASTADFTVTAGTNESGIIRMPAEKKTRGARVASTATQQYIYVTTDELTVTEATDAALYTSVNAIEATGNVNLVISETVADPMAKFGHIRRIIAKGTSISTTGEGTFKMSGFTVEVPTGDVAWTGTDLAKTTVDGVTIKVEKTTKLTLSNATFTNSTKSGSSNSGCGIFADGTNATWNGGGINFAE